MQIPAFILLAVSERQLLKWFPPRFTKLSYSAHSQLVQQESYHARIQSFNRPLAGYENTFLGTTPRSNTAPLGAFGIVSVKTKAAYQPLYRTNDALVIPRPHLLLCSSQKCSEWCPTKISRILFLIFLRIASPRMLTTRFKFEWDSVESGFPFKSRNAF